MRGAGKPNNPSPKGTRCDGDNKLDSFCQSIVCGRPTHGQRHRARGTPIRRR